MDSGYFFVNAALRHGKRTRLNHNKLKRDVELALQNDKWNDVRLGYSTYLKAQLEAGRNEIQRAKYITTINDDIIAVDPESEVRQEVA